MKAWVMSTIGPVTPGSAPLERVTLASPSPGDGDVLIKVRACGVCHTELDEIEGRTPPARLPRIPGHQVVGVVDKQGPLAGRIPLGTRVGVAWIFSACGVCNLCESGMENLCAHFRGTGRDADGGYAEYMVVPEAFAIPIPDALSDAEAAPLLCAGAVGYRSLQLAELTTATNLGLTGFGASAHLVLQMARYLYPDIKIAVFARSHAQQEFALALGADWAGATDGHSPFPLHAIIDTTPVWKPVVSALSRLEPGGRLIINAIRKEDGDQQELLRLDYGRHLWMEKTVKSVANVTRMDVVDCLKFAASAGIRPETQTYTFDEANQAIVDLRLGNNKGAKVLILL